MPDNELDPGASTQMFRAFVERDEQDAPATQSGNRLLWTWLLLAVVAVVIIGFLFLRG
jgi:hypothetical protein